MESVECGVRSINVECGVKSVECGAWNCAVGKVWSVQCGVSSVEYEV